ncbi:hypothetical protein HZB06_00495 [Candidatus Wolfebacteria bacterium]|nr:hypothetical protein [Candidatus Wolfebacteria bacterium]
MNYRCPHCDYVSDQAGNCPTCDAPLVAEEEGFKDNVDEMTEVNDKEEEME